MNMLEYWDPTEVRVLLRSEYLQHMKKECEDGTVHDIQREVARILRRRGIR